MKDSNSTDSQNPNSATPRDGGFSPWQRLKSKRISYLTLPLLIMATVTEFVILATGWRYQQVVCLPAGMAVTFFGIGPIGATILAVELLKLPLAIWTASRHGWQKVFMTCVGLPLICILTFQLVKDMAVYEMGVAMTPANHYLEKATTEEVKMTQLKGDLTAIEQKKTEREHKLAELSAKQAKAKAELDDSLKRNDDSRKDAISLTDYQRNQLNEVDAREATIVSQFNADTEQINKSLADLRTRREGEMSRDTRWNAEEARIENAYKTQLSAYENLKATYVKDKAEYDSANFLHRQLMHEPVDPGVPPVREANTILKSSLLADLDAQIKAKEAELLTVNAKRRDRIAQIENDAHQLRAQFEGRSGTKREEVDQKRDELLAAQKALEAESKTERKQIDDELAVAVEKVDGIRAEVDAAQKRAEGFYEQREASIRNTQVHRIATTVEIVRGLIKGERPMSIKATAKERGDILTDQISMVRIWVYPVLAFIVAFLPTLMVEIGFSTVFHPEQKRPAYRMGFLGRQLHSLYIRAGRQKILRAERLAKAAASEVNARDKALVAARVAAEKAVAEKEVELQAVREELRDTAVAQGEQMTQRENEWNGKFAELTESLTQALAEKDALCDFQHSEIERQVQLRQNTWSDRVAQLRQELDAQRTATEAERTTMTQEHHKKLMDVAEDWRAQVNQARRQAADAELALEEKTARQSYDLKEALNARDAATSQLQLQAEAFSLKLTQAKEDAARELEKAVRQEKHRLERQQLELAKTLRQSGEEFAHQLKQREQELALEFDGRFAREQARLEQDARRREEEIGRQIDARVREVEARWAQEVQQREEAAQIRLKQREQQLVAQSEVQLRDLQTQLEEQARRQEQEFGRQLESQTRDGEKRLQDELQQKELAFHIRLKQREQALTSKAVARETELQSQWAADLHTREEEWAQQAESRVRAVEARLGTEAQRNDELLQAKLRQRDQQWQIKLDSLRGELLTQGEEAVRRRAAEADIALRDLEARAREELQHKDEAAQANLKQRELDLTAQLSAQAEARRLASEAQWEAEAEMKIRAAVEPYKAQLARLEKERDEAKQASFETTHHVKHLEQKLTEASTFLNGWRNGKSIVGTE